MFLIILFTEANNKIIISKKKILSNSQQYLAVKSKYPKANCNLKKNGLIINLDLTPTEMSRTYPIKITYNYEGKCKAWLIGNISKLDDPNFPHNYGIDKNKKHVLLCLYDPRKFEWDGGDLISDTIIPWCIEWLFFYELWLPNSNWMGGGEHPTSK